MCVFYPKCQWCNWHLSFLAMLHTSGKESKASLTENSSQEGEECAQEEVKQVLEPVSHKALVAEQRKQVATPLERCHSKAQSSSEAAVHNASPTVNLLNILQQGWELRSVCIPGCCSRSYPFSEEDCEVAGWTEDESLHRTCVLISFTTSDWLGLCKSQCCSCTPLSPDIIFDFLAFCALMKTLI